MRYAVLPRDLSSTGVGFLHGSFMHVDSDCVVSMPTLTGEWIDTPGNVVCCQHVQGKVHEIGVHFRQQIDPTRFLTSGEDDEAHSGAGLPALTGSVLCVEDSQEDRNLVRFMLDRISVKVLVSSSVEEAVAMIETGVQVDLILTAHHAETLDGLKLAKALRDQGCQSPIILMTADESAQLRADAVAHGCNAILTRPFDVGTLLSVLLPHLHPQHDVIKESDGAPHGSRLWSDESMRPLIQSYLLSLTKQVRQLQQTLSGNDQIEAARAVCLQIKGSAGGYGFDLIGHAAQNLIGLIDADDHSAQVQQQFQEVVRMCAFAARACKADKTSA